MSPNVNSIENLWAELNRLTKDKEPKNENDLFIVLKTGWNRINVDYLHKLVESIPSRCKAIIKFERMPTKYRANSI